MRRRKRRLATELSSCSRACLLFVARRWLALVMTALGIYISLPWAAPILAKAGFTAASDFIYTIYSPFCHQFAFRSPFLFGEQAFYPRGIAGGGYAPFERYASESAAFLGQYHYWSSAFGGETAELSQFTPAQQFASRAFRGDEVMGYKTSLCARNLAIYSMLFVGGLVYCRFRWRIRPLPFLIYLVVGLGPIAIDGFSQMLGYPPFELWTPRETLPHFRLLTGGMFGLMSAWLAFPHLERSMRELSDSLRREAR